MSALDKIIDAAASGEVEQLQILIEQNPNLINETNEQGVNPLASALLNNKIESAKYLLSKNADKRGKISEEKTALEWARQQDKNEAALFLIAWDYIDRLYGATNMWKKHELKEAYCDVCFAKITKDDSTMLHIDEAFSARDYTEKIIDQAIKHNPDVLKNQSREEVEALIKDQIKNNSITGRYFVCDSCLEEFFADIVFGINREKVFELVNSIFEDN